MADRMHILDTGLPQFQSAASPEEKLDRLIDYLYQFLEEMQYLLRHLDAGNFSEGGLEELAEAVKKLIDEGDDG